MALAEVRLVREKSSGEKTGDIIAKGYSPRVANYRRFTLRPQDWGAPPEGHASVRR
jgi:hypothetical protein